MSFPENISIASSFFSRVFLLHSMVFLTEVWAAVFLTEYAVETLLC